MQPLFNNTEIAFSLKNNTELSRAYWLFKMMSYPKLVQAGTWLTNKAISWNLPVVPLIRATVFDHFCGGTTEQDCLRVVRNLHHAGVSSVLDYSVEGKESEEQFDAALAMTLKTIEFAKSQDGIPFAVFKPTGLGRFYLYEKKGRNESFSTEEQAEWDRVVARFLTVCQTAYDNDVQVLIDGEESWMQDAADDLALEMMRQFNKNKPLIFNTLQTYRWDRLDYLKKIQPIAQAEGFFIGMKVVRGAYMEKEAKRAADMGYPNPICKDKPTTDANFDATILYMMAHIDTMAIFAGTHNEESTYKLMTLMQQSGLTANDSRIWFGQLYGMSDNISFNLSKLGYNVAKYLPFGPVKEVMPYLIRRAQENTSVAGQTNRELMLLTTERQRRKAV